MIIGRDKEHVEIVECERVPDTLPSPGDVRVEVTVKLQDFGGRYAEVWLAKPELETFVREFESVLKTGTGKVCLEAMSPNELTLKIEPCGGRGCCRLHVRLGRHQYSGDTYWPTSVQGGFEIESGALPSVLAGFKAMLE